MTEPFKCPKCGRVSHHPEDRRQGWCGVCGDVLSGIPKLVPIQVSPMSLAQDVLSCITQLKARYAKLCYEAKYMPRLDLSNDIYELFHYIEPVEAAARNMAGMPPVPSAEYATAYGKDLIEIHGTEAVMKPAPPLRVLAAAALEPIARAQEARLGAAKHAVPDGVVSAAAYVPTPPAPASDVTPAWLDL